ncbi:tail fiber protein [Escherichia coli]|uniref:tail fiber protein n=1 Tax=Escherichia coli TaxID=562 RepID=UPI0017D72DE6|nr:tail fiber protein [Escherichia coli]EFH5039605.1 phage tail protein [Escherichia coli]EHT5197864.1 tail fiber protein [Escherichia coli]MBZ8707949.1 tail fiber protein [Escherichia coli]MBZ8722909.1 tail fiber protein [Escherichia coli]MBZ8728118.1 tail fiber protein [Escherichia coli]
MAINNFKPFALDPNANVTSQADWEALPALLSGFTAGKASSAQVNKAIRQASFIAAALAQYTANKSGLDVLDDGDLNGFISKMGTAFGKDFQALDATLSALAGLATGANKLPYFTGNDTAAQTDLTSVGRDIIGKNTIADILTYLGLGEGSALPVGVPVPWPSATPPTGWLKCNGAPFSAEEYPKLAKAYPKLKLPDLRGEFIRGWDDGRGVDSARLLLSSQAASILEHNHEMHGWTGNPLMARDVYSSGSSVFAVQLSIGDGGLLYSWKDGSGTTNDSKRMDRTNHVSSGAGDGSPRNIAFNYIVRAA